MISIEGIRLLTARLEAAEKAKKMKARRRARMAAKRAGTGSRRRGAYAAQ